MVINPFKAFLLTAGGAVGAAGIAYYSGALDSYLAPKPVSAVVEVQPEATTQPAIDGTAATPAAPDASAEAPAATVPVVAPSFDIVRAEADGSLVVAGKAAPDAMVEIVAGAQVLGTVKAGPDGDFVIVLDDPLKPGSHQLVLRATGADGLVATSPETAVVSIPESKDGQVLALVESPGEPSKLITVPEPETPQEVASAAEAVAPATTPEPVGEKVAVAETLEQPAPAVAPAPAEPAASTEVVAPAEPVAPPAPSAPASAIAKVSVDAVEIEGRKIFVAGAADPGRRVRVYANDILLGDAISSPGGRFLIETERDLPVGDYIIRADALEADGVKVAARAAVPFEREAGEAIAAVAPKPAPDTTEQPAPVAQAPVVATEQSAAAEAAVAPQPTPAEPEQKVAEAKVEASAPKLQSVDGSVIIRRGDTLWQISRRVYGRGVRYSTIYLANQNQITDPNRIWPGQVFSVPEKTPEGEAADLSTIENPASADAGEAKTPL